jgi:hypothetical protein
MPFSFNLPAVLSSQHGRFQKIDNIAAMALPRTTPVHTLYSRVAGEFVRRRPSCEWVKIDVGDLHSGYRRAAPSSSPLELIVGLSRLPIISGSGHSVVAFLFRCFFF